MYLCACSTILQINKKWFSIKCLSTYSYLYFNCRLSVRYVCNLKINSIVLGEVLLYYVVLVQICAIVPSISINLEGSLELYLMKSAVCVFLLHILDHLITLINVI